MGGLLIGAICAAAAAGVLLTHQPLRHDLRAWVWPGHTYQTPPESGLGDVTVTVDGRGRAHPISPDIYGVSQADEQTLKALGATVDRWGGNQTSTYNWVLGDAWNAGRDWGFRNVNYLAPETGSASDHFVSGALAASAAPLITIPTLGWVARDGDPRHRSTKVPAQGGPPLRPGSPAIAGYDPTANRQANYVPSFPDKPGPLLDHPVPGGPVYQNEWVHHLVDRFGPAPAGVRFFTMGNEPDLWSQTHTDVQPVEVGYEGALRNFEAYAQAVKAQDPKALILGPDAFGWTGYFYSALDRGTDNFATHADRQAHGGEAFVPWFLDQMSKEQRRTGKRLLDVLDVHYYPQASRVFSSAADAATRALRIRSVRSLWDPNYSDESWIGQSVELIPRLRSWINAHYPGTKLAITEYNWGGEQDASGAVALAEVLGTFGREGVDLATYWPYPPPNSPAGAAFRLYRNYDGLGGTFGDRELSTKVDRAYVTAFAARHSKGGETDVIVANETQDRTARFHLSLSGFHPASADEFLLAAGSSRIIQVPMASAHQAISLPPLSVALVRLKPA